MKVFISYRRDDSQVESQFIQMELVREIGEDNVFFDVDDIPYGVNFKTYLADMVAECGVMLVMMGRGWGDSQDERGDRRLTDPRDFVRIEIESAFARDLKIIPVLLNGARMPGPDDLPESLQRLSYLNAAEIRWGRDLNIHRDRLFRAIKNIRAAQPDEPSSPMVMLEPAWSEVSTVKERPAPVTDCELEILVPEAGVEPQFVPDVHGLQRGTGRDTLRIAESADVGPQDTEMVDAPAVEQAPVAEPITKQPEGLEPTRAGGARGVDEVGAEADESLVLPTLSPPAQLSSVSGNSGEDKRSHNRLVKGGALLALVAAMFWFFGVPGGVHPDGNDASTLLTRCEVGEGEACRQAGLQYQKGRDGRPPEPGMAMTFFKKACDADNADGCMRYGYGMKRGVGVKRDVKLAVTYDTLACERGSATGCYNLGWTYKMARGVKEDMDRANTLFKKACDAGKMMGCNSLGVSYAQGLGALKKDIAKASLLYLQACEGALGKACANLALLYEHGKAGLPKNCGADKLCAKREVARLYNQACRFNYEDFCERSLNLTANLRAHEMRLSGIRLRTGRTAIDTGKEAKPGGLNRKSTRLVAANNQFIASRNPNKRRGDAPKSQPKEKAWAYLGQGTVTEPCQASTMIAPLTKSVAKLAKCYELALQRMPDVGGQLIISWMITKQGTSKAIETENAVGDPKMRRCVVKEIRRLRFPSHDGPACKARYPYRFSRRKVTR